MPPTSTKRALALIALAALPLIGCATVPMASAEEDLRVKKLVPPVDAALIYLYRNESFGAGVHMDVLMDGWAAGQTVANTYMVWQVRPGVHMVTSKAENDTSIGVDTVAGHRYFIWQEVKMGVMYARSRLQLVSDAEGLKGVNECKLVQMPRPSQRSNQPPAQPPPKPSPPALDVTSAPAPAVARRYFSVFPSRCLSALYFCRNSRCCLRKFCR